MRAGGIVLAASGLMALGACASAPRGEVDIVAAAEHCEQQARASMGPTGEVTVGFNSRSGPTAELAVGLTSDYLRRRDPLDVYSECVIRRTGAAPYRPPVLR
ncbi:hypothetical protein BVG79_00137 [Ketogulonicigenium robustum]|uniref:Lipoprotein n=1 Tax=Ketogulonicigenium robustum TaxID=92947 RepID=A0A1W6NWV9_9RHOB|nr:hypothetical protein [Ketogulonicigenium robustum]ARO13497.1 hypothetical protein BVG79_00137 [Ketogulonicigenium robustum]